MSAPRVDRALLTVHQPRLASVEASTAGLRPGSWPAELEVVSGPGSDGTVVFYRSRPITGPTEEFGGFVYVARKNGQLLELRVWND